jgi:hypothetical protein
MDRGEAYVEEIKMSDDFQWWESDKNRHLSSCSASYASSSTG